MSWLDSIDLAAITPADFGKRLRQRLKKPIAANEFISLYNRIIVLAQEQPTVAGSFADTAVSLFKLRRDPHRQALFLELSARSWMQAGEVTRALGATKSFLSVARTKRQFRDLVDLTDDLCNGTLTAADELMPKVLALATAVYAKAKLPEKQVNAYLAAATVFARHGAIQAAYRAAHDAEDIARQTNSLRLLAKASIIAYDERDFEWSANVGRQALEAYAALGLPPPAALRSNTATAMMNTGAHKEALENFEALLSTLGTDDQLVKFQVHLNLAACRRRLGDVGRDGCPPQHRSGRRCCILREVCESKAILEIDKTRRSGGTRAT
jgi:tetratricopeptide (TPR) repeat protein